MNLVGQFVKGYLLVKDENTRWYVIMQEFASTPLSPAHPLRPSKDVMAGEISTGEDTLASSDAQIAVDVYPRTRPSRGSQ